METLPNNVSVGEPIRAATVNSMLRTIRTLETKVLKPMKSGAGMPRSRVKGGQVIVETVGSDCRAPFQACFRLYKDTNAACGIPESCILFSEEYPLFLNVNGGTWFGNGISSISHGITREMMQSHTPSFARADAFAVDAGEVNIATLKPYCTACASTEFNIGVPVASFCIKSSGGVPVSAVARLASRYSVYLFDKCGNDCEGVKAPELFYNCSTSQEPYSSVVGLMAAGLVRAVFVGNFVPVVCLSAKKSPQDPTKYKFTPKKVHLAKWGELSEAGNVVQMLKSDYFYPAGSTTQVASSNLETWQEIAPNLWRYRGSAGIISRFMTTQGKGTWYSSKTQYRTPCGNECAFDFTQSAGAVAAKSVFKDLRARGYGSGCYYPQDLSEESSEIRSAENWCEATSAPFRLNNKAAFFGFRTTNESGAEFYDFSASCALEMISNDDVGNALIVKRVFVQMSVTEQSQPCVSVGDGIEVYNGGARHCLFAVGGSPQPVFLENAKLAKKYGCVTGGFPIEYFRSVEYLGFNSGENCGNGGRMYFEIPVPIGVLRAEKIKFPCYVCVQCAGGEWRQVLCWREIKKAHVSAETLGVSIPSALFGVRYENAVSDWTSEFSEYSALGATSSELMNNKVNITAKDTPTGGSKPAPEVISQTGLSRLSEETEHVNPFAPVSISPLAASVLSSGGNVNGGVILSPFDEDSAEIIEAQDL